jgi:hypothetical protein
MPHNTCAEIFLFVCFNSIKTRWHFPLRQRWNKLWLYNPYPKFLVNYRINRIWRVPVQFTINYPNITFLTKLICFRQLNSLFQYKIVFSINFVMNIKQWKKHGTYYSIHLRFDITINKIWNLENINTKCYYTL